MTQRGQHGLVAALSVFQADGATVDLLGQAHKVIGISERALSEAFRSEFSLSVSGWLREERLRTARHLIVTTDTPILAISEHLGFATQSNFAKAFRQRFGFTPTEARARMRGQAET